METKNKTCEDRIMENLESCEEDLDLFYSILDDNLDPDDEDDALKIAKIEDNGYDEDSIYEYALGVSTKKVIRIDLSTGGPGSFIEAEVDDNNDVVEVFYYFQDWFDGAKRKVSTNSPIYRYAQEMAERLS